MSGLQVVVTIVLAFVSGIGGAFVKPWGLHHFAELKSREDHRRELIGQWRTKISELHDEHRAWVDGDTRVDEPPIPIYGQTWIENLRGHLAKDDGSIEHLNLPLKHLLDNRQSVMDDANMRLLNTTVTQLAREWKVTVSGRRRAFGLWW